jgi:hypothetical protein
MFIRKAGQCCGGDKQVGVCPVYLRGRPRGGTLIRGSEIVSTAPVSRYENSEKPAVQQASSIEGEQKFSFVPVVSTGRCNTLVKSFSRCFKV